MTRSQGDIELDNFSHVGHSSNKYGTIGIHFYEHTQVVRVFIKNFRLHFDKAINISSVTSKGANLVYIQNMEVMGVTNTKYVIIITITESDTALDIPYANMIYFQDCTFIKINGKGTILAITDSYGLRLSVIFVMHCRFTNINSSSIIKTKVNKAVTNIVLTVNIHNTSFLMLKDAGTVISVESTCLMLIGPVIFSKIVNHIAIIHLANGKLQIHDYIMFSQNKANYCMVLSYIMLLEKAKLVIMENDFSVVFYVANDHDKYSFLCLFQYEQWLVPGAKISQPQDKQLNYSIVFQHNVGKVLSNKRFVASNCDWLEESIFSQSDPYEVNKQIIQYVNNSMAVKFNVPNTICLCTDDQDYNCSVDELEPVYPGQTLALNVLIAINESNDTVKTHVDNLKSLRACRSNAIKDYMLLTPGVCTKLEYKSILYKNGNSCNIFLSGKIILNRVLSTGDIKHDYVFLDAFRIKFLTCPLGFALNELLQICQCDPILKPVVPSAENCNIDSQTVLRPASSWIVGYITANNSHTYEVSLHCPFDYCLPHSSYIDLSNIVSQCQFKRNSLLCGKCIKGLSTVFGTSQCKKCSNYYLFLLLPFTLVGIAVIMLLFVSNFTVVDGNINGLIFYANIVSINGPVFFPSYASTKYAYVLISFLNLDLGIEACFYNGMTDYAKMWLQLIFPVYLIFIATFLIITSRYSTRIQRLTARKALPVLASLFLLSYTKILRTVSNVLFFYTTVTSLPSKKTTLVWSVDPEVELFELKLILLFVVCLVVFLMLIPFNSVLVFSRLLSQFKCVNHFKPLLDVYQGPYKDRFYYWTGLQLVLRAVFYGVSALDRDTNMMISILILGVMECIFGLQCPFKHKDRNYQELALLFNLQALFAASSYTTSNSTAVNTLVGFALLQFIIFTLCQIKFFSFVKGYFLKLLTNFKLKHCFSCINPQRANIRNVMELKNPAPEVAYRYDEFREPLIGQDK